LILLELLIPTKKSAHFPELSFELKKYFKYPNQLSFAVTVKHKVGLCPTSPWGMFSVGKADRYLCVYLIDFFWSHFANKSILLPILDIT